MGDARIRLVGGQRVLGSDHEQMQRFYGRALRQADQGCAEFWVSGNAYVRAGTNGDGSDEVRLVDYDPSWPRQFQEMAVWLQQQLGPDVAMRVEHYGSTAVAGMPAKPVVDLLVEIPPSWRRRKGLSLC